MADEQANSEFLDNIEQYLEQADLETPKKGEMRQGIIVSITEEAVIVDLGFKRDGLVPSSDLNQLSAEEKAELKENQELPVYIIGQDSNGSLLVSLSRALIDKDWEKADALLETQDVYEGEVSGYNKGGLLVQFGRIQGFIPISHMMDGRNLGDERQRQRALSNMRGNPISAKVIEVDRRRRRLVFSQKAAEEELVKEKRAELIAGLNKGDTLTGTVRSIRDFGVFVDLGNGIDGLVHISELSWHRVENPKEVVKNGDEIEVEILKINEEQQRVSLSRKRLLPHPWEVAADKYLVGELVEGRVTRIAEYGAFVSLEPGIEGLLHTSKVARAKIEHPSEVLQEGETHLLRIISVEPDRQRIGLSLRDVSAQEQINWMALRPEEPEAPEAPAKSEPVAEATPQAAAETVEVEEVSEPVVETAEAVEADAPTAVEEVVVEETAAEEVSESDAEAVETVADEIEVEIVEPVAGEPLVEEATILIVGDDPETPQVEVTETINVKVTKKVVEGDDSDVSATSEMPEVVDQSSMTIIGDDPSTPEVELSETTNVTVTEKIVSSGEDVDVEEYSDDVAALIAKYASDSDESDAA